MSAAFGIGAAAAASVAAGATKIAGDPPEPNSRYTSVLEVRVPEVGEALGRFELLSATSRVLDAAVRLVAHIDALSEVEGRLLGAPAAKDHSALELQLASYRDLLRSIAAQSEHLMRYAPLLARELDASTILAHGSGRMSEVVAAPPDIPELLKQGVLGGRLAALSSRMAESVAIPVANMRSVSDALAAMAGFLLLLASAAQSNGLDVQRRFSGERS